MKAQIFLLIPRKVALERGIVRYFTGVPCKFGHTSERLVSTSYCVECSRERQRSDDAKRYKRDNYTKNKEKVLSKAKENYLLNRNEKIKKSCDYQKKNIKKIYQRNKVRESRIIEEKPWLRIHLRLKSGISQALRALGSSKKGSKTMDIVGCSKDELRDHIEKQFLKGMTWSNRDLWHIDHIVPISKATSEKEVLGLYHFSNLRPLWAIDNIRKSNKEVFLI